MVVKEQELLAARDDQNAAKEAAQKVDNTLRKVVLDHSLVLANKDNEIRILWEELNEAKIRQDDIVGEYRKSIDLVFRLANHYNGGWAAAMMRCARHAIPDLDWSKVEEAHGRRDYEIPLEDEVLDMGVTEANIANANPRCEFKDDQGQDQDADVGLLLLEILMTLWSSLTVPKGKSLSSRVNISCSLF